MDIRKVTDTFSVAPQIALDDVAAIAQAGFATIICNRPDEEEAGQLSFATMKVEAEKHGLDVKHIPIASGMFGPQHITQMEHALQDSDGNTLAYCRSGTRSIMLWAFQEVTKRPRDEVLKLASDAGYDLSQQL